MRGRARQGPGRAATFAIVCGMAWVLTACESDREFKRDIPEGQGTLVLNNLTTSDIYVYIEGVEDRRTSSKDYEFYDRDPGVYRVVLEQRRGDRSWAGYVDVLLGKKTVLDVYFASYHRDFDVYRRIQ